MYALDLLCFGEPFCFDLRAMRQYALRPGAIVLVAEREATLVGFIIASVNERRRSAYLVTLDVHPLERRRGMARMLTSEAEDLAVAAGVESIDLHVYSGNAAAVEFYEGLGYVRVCAHPEFYGPGLDAWTYAKELVPAPVAS